MTVDIPNLKSFKTKPEITVGSVRLCQSELELSLAIDPKDLAASLAEMYPEKSVAQIFEWIIFFKNNGVSLDNEDLAKAYGFFWNENTHKVFNAYTKTPCAFKNWSNIKKAHINDLRALTLIIKLNQSEQKLVYELLGLYEDLNPSLNDGKKIIELFIDCVSSSYSEANDLVKQIINKNLKSDKIIKKLLKLRYPAASQADDQMRNFIISSRWPSTVKVKFQRQGDKSGFEVSTYISNSDQSDKAKGKLHESLDSLSTYFKNKGQRL